MRNLPQPFKFDFGTLLKKAEQKVNTRVEGVSINLPFITINVKPDNLEKTVAKEIVIRLAEPHGSFWLPAISLFSSVDLIMACLRHLSISVAMYWHRTAA